MDAAKLAKLQAQVRIGGKGTPRRKHKVVHKAPIDDKKVQGTLKKVCETFLSLFLFFLFLFPPMSAGGVSSASP